MSYADTMAKIADAKADLRKLEDRAHAQWLEEGRARPLLERLRFAAHARCRCRLGLAYDPWGESGRAGRGAWTCSGVLLGTADRNVQHDEPKPFAFYEIESEGQPSACGASTRPLPKEASPCT